MWRARSRSSTRPSASQDQFYEPATGQVRTQCARSTSARALAGTPDGHGGLLVVVRAGDGFADANGALTPPPDTAIVRIADDCLWDRQFAAPGIDPANPADLTMGLPVRVGNVVLAANAVIVNFFLQAQVAAFDAATGRARRLSVLSEHQRDRLAGRLGRRAAIARVRDSSAGAYTLGAVTLRPRWPSTRARRARRREQRRAHLGARPDAVSRASRRPSAPLEAYDLDHARRRRPAGPRRWRRRWRISKWSGARVFLAAGVVNGQAVAQPAAVLAATGALDATWTPRAADPPHAGSVGHALRADPHAARHRRPAPVPERRLRTRRRQRSRGRGGAVGGHRRRSTPWDPAPLLVQPARVLAPAAC